MTKQSRQYYVYIVSNKTDTVFYVGITSNLIKRIFEHKNKVIDGFTSKYNINKLVYYEIYMDAEEAIKREKQIKAGSRQDKINLVSKINLNWSNLYDKICE